VVVEKKKNPTTLPALEFPLTLGAFGVGKPNTVK